MRSLRFLIVGLLALGASFPVLPISSASAVVTPVIYNDANGWSDAAVRPHWIIIGEGGAPQAHTWYWSIWNSRYARSTGTLWVYNCTLDCIRSRPSYHKLVVTLSHVKHHHGRAYFSVMTWYTPHYRSYGYKTSTATFHLSANGYWQ